MGVVAATVDCAAETAPAVTTTVAVWVIATVLIVADTVFDSATVELRLPVATPLALVVPTGCVRVFPVPVAASTTAAPAIGLPFASLAVTVMVDVPLPAVMGDVAATVDKAADPAPAVTGTGAAWGWRGCWGAGRVASGVSPSPWGQAPPPPPRWGCRSHPWP